MEWALVRAPLLPVSAYYSLRGGPPESLAASPQVREALAIGSEALSNALDGDGNDGNHRASRRRSRLLSYLIRMSTRPTPYGLFAATGIVRIGRETTLELDDTRPRPTRTRPDAAWLFGLVEELELRPDILANLNLVAHSAICEVGGRVELPPATQSPGDPGVSVRATSAVMLTLRLCATPTSYHEVVSALLNMPDATPAKAGALIRRLIDHKLLQTDLTPPLTSRKPAEHVMERLARIPVATAATQGLSTLLDKAAEWDRLRGSALVRTGAAQVDEYRSLTAEARALHAGGLTAPAMQVDAALPLRGTLARGIAEEVARAIDLLMRLTPRPESRSLPAGSRAQLALRYGSDADVGLLELMEFISSTMQHGTADGAVEGDTVDASAREARHRALFRLAQEAARDHRRSVELDPVNTQDIELWEPQRALLPATLEGCVYVAAPDRAALDAGEFRILVGANLGAPAAGRYLGRFADLLGEQAIQAMAGVAAAEAFHRPERVFAELVYKPARARSANVATRLHPYTHEVVLGASPGVDYTQVVPLSELVVSIRGQRLVLRWPRHDCEVVCTMSHMLNTSQAPVIVQFLESLSRDHVAAYSAFDWGPAAQLPFLPRIQTGRIILSPAQWRTDGKECPLGSRDVRRDRFADRLASWRRAWDVPRHAYLTVHDHRLLLDLEDNDQASILKEELANGPALLEEPIPGPEDAWLPGCAGSYIAEVVVPVVLRGPPVRPPTTTRRAIVARDPSARLRLPGSDWLFLKLYCQTAVVDELVAGPLGEFTDFLTGTGVVQRWFFLRYADPEPHVRLRLHGTPALLTDRVFGEACAWAAGLVATGFLSRFGVDTYDREIERYGGLAGVALAEEIFAIDSRAVTDILRVGYAPFEREEFAVRTIDDLLGGFGLPTQDRLQWYRHHATRSRDNGLAYRRRKTTLRQLLGTSSAASGLPPAVEEVLRARTAGFSTIAPSLTGLDDRHELNPSLDTIYGSYIHLHCNRLGLVPAAEDRTLGLALRTREGLARTLGHPAP